jgi:hypothetical protein
MKANIIYTGSWSLISYLDLLKEINSAELTMTYQSQNQLAALAVSRSSLIEPGYLQPTTKNGADHPH